MSTNALPKLIVSPDGMPLGQARLLINQISQNNPDECVAAFKANDLAIGVDKSLWRLFAPGQAEFFLDLKWCDQPDTVARYVESYAPYANMMSVWAMGGLAMMKAAVQAAKDYSENARIIAITVPTGMNNNDCMRLFGRDVESAVLFNAQLAAEAGVWGVTCAGREAEAGAIKACSATAHLKVITPGMRFRYGGKGDQKRWATPRQATLAGADYLVCGSLITGRRDGKAANPGARLRKVIASMKGESMHRLG